MSSSCSPFSRSPRAASRDERTTPGAPLALPLKGATPADRRSRIRGVRLMPGQVPSLGPVATSIGGGLSSPRLAMVAGEASGDLLAGLLLGGLVARWPSLATFGIGGPQMARHGFDAWWPHEKLAVRGYVEVLKHYREIAGIRRALGQRLLRERPDAFIGVDVPDFNLDLEGRLKAKGIKAIHFVSPSIWAWRGGRMDKIRRSVDHMLCLFPFEPAIYRDAGVAATYVGHPLADEIPLEPPRAASRGVLG